MRYIQEKLSKNDTNFLQILKMKPGKENADKLNKFSEKVFEQAEKKFTSKLRRYTEKILDEFTGRLNIRIEAQEKQMNQHIKELENLQNEAREGQIDINNLKEKNIPVMETAECIIRVLEMEV